jgi:hypothetical protein
VEDAAMKNSDVSGEVKNDHAEYARKALEDSDMAKEWEVVVADDFHIQLDYDNQNALLLQDTLEERFFVTRDILQQRIGYKPDYAVLESKGGNIHVVITLREGMDVRERVAWQAAFGSDFKREALHLKSIAAGELNPILLYMRKK